MPVLSTSHGIVMFTKQTSVLQMVTYQNIRDRIINQVLNISNPKTTTEKDNRQVKIYPFSSTETT